ncbi:MAG: CoA pyrophosphatase [Azospirillaceae bacterium]
MTGPRPFVAPGRGVGPESLRDILPRRLAEAEAARRLRGDFDLNPGMARPESPRQAAVLIALIDRPEGHTILLTQRTRHLARHAGQIAFPGGRLEPGDADALCAALRETEEEVGLGADRVETIGALDPYLTRTGFEITPVLGFVRPPEAWRPDPQEVDEVFEVPLDFILAPGNPVRHSRVWQGIERFFWVYPFGERYIWGATAGMLTNLREIVTGEALASSIDGRASRPPA